MRERYGTFLTRLQGLIVLCYSLVDVVCYYQLLLAQTSSVSYTVWLVMDIRTEDGVYATVARVRTPSLVHADVHKVVDDH